jgi:hypothetical protein
MIFIDKCMHHLAAKELLTCYAQYRLYDANPHLRNFGILPLQNVAA